MSRKKHKIPEAEAAAAPEAELAGTVEEAAAAALRSTGEAPDAETGSLVEAESSEAVAVEEAVEPLPKGAEEPVVEAAESVSEEAAEDAAPAAVLDVPAPRRVLDDAELQKALESLLFITDQPLGLSKLCSVLGIKDSSRIEAIVKQVRADYEARGGGLQLLEIAEGFQLATKPDFAPFVRKLYSERMTMRLSTAALETLAIVAYKQPLTRAEIEEIRGVEVIAAIETLLEKRLIKVVGRKESVGRPLLYGTTPEFLRQFGLRSAADLPPIDSFTPEEPAQVQGQHGPFAGTAQLEEYSHDVSPAASPSEGNIVAEVSEDMDAGASLSSTTSGKALSIEEAAREAVAEASDAEPVPEEKASEDAGGLEDVARRALEDEPGQD